MTGHFFSLQQLDKYLLEIGDTLKALGQNLNESLQLPTIDIEIELIDIES